MGGLYARNYHIHIAICYEKFKEVAIMAQKVAGYIKLQIPAGKATPAPPVGPALGQHGVNIMQFAKEFNLSLIHISEPTRPY